MSHHQFILLPILSAGIIGCIAIAQVNAALPELTPLNVFSEAFENEESNIQVRQSGVIVSILTDDTVGDRHQRMIVRLENDQTLLITHNIDLAPRVPSPIVGKVLSFYGEYEWNDKGGVVHWTHEDPDGSHVAGWLEYEGKRYGRTIATSALVPAATHKIVNRKSVNSERSQFTVQGKVVPYSALHRATQVYFKKSTVAKQGVVSF